MTCTRTHHGVPNREGTIRAESVCGAQFHVPNASHLTAKHVITESHVVWRKGRTRRHTGLVCEPVRWVI